jgi:hypothetical protein
VKIEIVDGRVHSPSHSTTVLLLVDWVNTLTVEVLSPVTALKENTAKSMLHDSGVKKVGCRNVFDNRFADVQHGHRFA